MNTLRKQRGVAILVVLAIIAILTVLSTTLIKQLGRDRSRQKSRENQAQIERLTVDANNGAFLERFVEKGKPASAIFTDASSGRDYEITVDPTSDPPSVSVSNPKKNGVVHESTGEENDK